ncbi:MAG: AMP-binding protein [Endomicrobium sp.]|jgi:acetyl-CoA synthetase|nr:AMP-binding protein [Endomicrobium sp.]
MLISRYLTKTNYDSYKDFNDNCRIYTPYNFNFAFDVVDTLANFYPNKKAIIWCDDNENNKIFTFYDISKKSNKAANFFKDIGIKKGDVVMLILRRHYEYWICTVALHKLGALIIPATHLLTYRDLLYRVKIAKVKVIVALANTRICNTVNEVKNNQLSELKFTISVDGHINNWIDYSKEVNKYSDIFNRPTGEESTNINDNFLLYFTSGTTGMPKMVCHNFSYPLGHIITAKFWQQLNANSLHLTVADTGWAKASWGKIYGQWLCEACVFVYDYEKFNSKKLLAKIVKYNVTSFCAPPTIYRYLIKEDLSKYNLSKLKYVVTAGEPLNPEVFYKFKQNTGLEIKEGFGQTESVVCIATFPWMIVKPGSIGKPSAGWELDIIDEKNHPCHVGEAGRLIIKTSKNNPVGLFSGYYNNRNNLQQLNSKFYDTGDIVYKDKDGYFWFVARADDIIKSSGYRIGPFEVENAIMEHPCVLECAVTGVPDNDRGQIVKASIVLSAGYYPSPKLTKNIQDHVKKITAPYKYPRLIEFVRELPKTVSGKIKRNIIIEGTKTKKYYEY